MSLELWTFAPPNGWKVTIMLEELIEAGVELPPVEVKTVDISRREQFSEAFTAVNPNQKIPGLRDGDVPPAGRRSPTHQTVSRRRQEAGPGGGYGQ